MMTIFTHLLLTLFATPPITSGEALVDVCDVMNPTTGAPSICEPHPDGAPIYDDIVCCNSRLCFEPGEAGCRSDEEPLYCGLGDVGASGVVTCYFEVPRYCDVFPCDHGIQAPPQESVMCCSAGICWNVYDDGDPDCELDDIYWCDHGVTNQDGTVTCFDE